MRFTKRRSPNVVSLGDEIDFGPSAFEEGVRVRGRIVAVGGPHTARVRLLSSGREINWPYQELHDR